MMWFSLQQPKFDESPSVSALETGAECGHFLAVADDISSALGRGARAPSPDWLSAAAA